jgi:aerobic-type carbon monoxide dehydrogenase small subunit (CoxS/CutS family)
MFAGLGRHDDILTVEMLRCANGHDVHSRLLERLGQIVVHGHIAQSGFCGAVTSFLNGLAANRYDLRVRILLQGCDMLCRDPTGTMHKNA